MLESGLATNYRHIKDLPVKIIDCNSTTKMARDSALASSSILPQSTLPSSPALSSLIDVDSMSDVGKNLPLDNYNGWTTVSVTQDDIIATSTLPSNAVLNITKIDVLENVEKKIGDEGEKTVR